LPPAIYQITLGGAGRWTPSASIPLTCYFARLWAFSTLSADSAFFFDRPAQMSVPSARVRAVHLVAAGKRFGMLAHHLFSPVPGSGHQASCNSAQYVFHSLLRDKPMQPLYRRFNVTANSDSQYQVSVR
jgi:hypothetical protein